MPTTPRLGLRYPALTDAPNGPQALQNLGLDVESWLNRAFPCTSSTRPGAPTTGMVIYESDTGEWRGWTGAAWEQINGTSSSGGGTGGAGGAATVVADAQYSASSTQTIPEEGPGLNAYPVAFGSANLTTDYIERSPRGVGHEFELTIGGLWAVSATVKYARLNGSNGELTSGLYTTASGTEPVVEAGFDNESSPCTLFWSVTRRFAAGAVLYVQTRNSGGLNRALDRGVNGSKVRINFALVGR